MPSVTPAAPARSPIGRDTAPDTARDLAALMARLRPLAAAGAGRLGAEVGLTPGQLAALLAVEEGATGVSAVADQCLTHLSNASRTIDALVRDGLVDRTRDPLDGRAVVLSVTSDGRRRLARLHRRRDDLMQAALDEVDADDQARLVDLLARLVDGLEQALHDDQA